MSSCSTPLRKCPNSSARSSTAPTGGSSGRNYFLCNAADGEVRMAFKRKGSWLAVSAVVAVTALMMLRLAAAVPQEVRSRIAAAFQVHTRAGNVDKKPLRYIKDPNPAWSSIAVNPENNMVVMTDENLFRIVEYSRLDNTPPKARFTEPKGIISGDQPRMEILCGAYTDPKTPDVYV